MESATSVKFEEIGNAQNAFDQTKICGIYAELTMKYQVFNSILEANFLPPG